MNEENIGLEIAKEAIKEVGKDVYNDVGKPIVKPTGELVGLVPRAIKAAFLPLEKWVMQREYNIAETQKLLELKLQNVSPELIEPPEPYIAVPALQYISYCMDCDELRDMYANLLANSMNKVVRNGVHPGFVEIIKQLCPDEAKILKYINFCEIIPSITLRYVRNSGGGIDIIKNFSDVGEKAKCENPRDVAKYFDNLVRLGLIISSDGLSALSDKTKYEPLKSHKWVATLATNEKAKIKGFDKIDFEEGFFMISSYGKSFCQVCLDTQKAFVVEMKESDD